MPMSMARVHVHVHADSRVRVSVWTASAHRQPITIETDDPYFAIHHATALEEEGGSEEELLRLTLYTAAWPRVGEGPFLGDWGGDVPVYDDGKINPTQLLRTSIVLPSSAGGAEQRVAAATGSGATPPSPQVERTVVADGACIDHPHVDPRFDGDASVRCASRGGDGV